MNTTLVQCLHNTCTETHGHEVDITIGFPMGTRTLQLPHHRAHNESLHFGLS